MITYPDPTTSHTAGLSVNQLAADRWPSATRGNVSVNAQWQHFSLLAYAVPPERIVGLAPSSFEVETSLINGRLMAWVSVASLFDQGARGDGQSRFEQTSYRLHVRRDGASVAWLLGLSLGSLAAVATRNWWGAPWHLGAMEFQLAYDEQTRRYHHYQLQTQSQWINARWQLTDSGQLLDQAELPAMLQHPFGSDYFLRRDGLLGSQRARLLNPRFTRGVVQTAHCDLLERLGILRGAEFLRPQLAALQQSLVCQLDAPAIVGAVNTTPMRLAA